MSTRCACCCSKDGEHEQKNGLALHMHASACSTSGSINLMRCCTNCTTQTNLLLDMPSKEKAKWWIPSFFVNMPSAMKLQRFVCRTITYFPFGLFIICSVFFLCHFIVTFNDVIFNSGYFWYPFISNMFIFIRCANPVTMCAILVLALNSREILSCDFYSVPFQYLIQFSLISVNFVVHLNDYRFNLKTTLTMADMKTPL